MSTLLIPHHDVRTGDPHVRRGIHEVLEQMPRLGALVPPADPARQPPLEEVRAHPGVARLLRTEPGSGLLVPVEILQPDGAVARFMTTLATVGTAQDLTLRELRIETFHPIAG